MSMLTAEEVNRRLERAKDLAVSAVILCWCWPIFYYGVAFLFREDLIELYTGIRLISFGNRAEQLLFFMIIGTPWVSLPIVYNALTNRIALKADLVCPECGAVHPDGEDWQIILFTKKCPCCQKQIIATNQASSR